MKKKKKEKVTVIKNHFTFEEGGMLLKILWAMSIINLEREVRTNRRRLEARFDEQLKLHPDDVNLIDKKARCLKQFDEANLDTMSNVKKAREFFSKNPEFSGLIIPEKRHNPEPYFDSFDRQVQCEEVYNEHGMADMSRQTEDCQPFN